MKRFQLIILLRVLGITLSVVLGTLSIFIWNNYALGVIMLVVLVIMIVQLNYFVQGANHKLTLFLESIKSSDFTTKFSLDNSWGKSFHALNDSFNEVLEAFKKTRAEGEENFQYLNAIVRQVTIGIISYDQSGNVRLINHAALRLLGIQRLKHISDLTASHEELVIRLKEMKHGKKALIKLRERLQLSVTATEIKIGAEYIRIISLQNIRTELEEKEVESWQNLTKILRHEIMNSIAPISSLVNSLKDIAEQEISVPPEQEESRTDLLEGLHTIRSRSDSLIKFVDAYRQYTEIPKPDLVDFQVKDLFTNLETLMKAEIEGKSVSLKFSIIPSQLKLHADEEMIEMILINLIKNSIDALSQSDQGIIHIRAAMDSMGNRIIEVIDNGPGMVEEAINKVFIPFYTTKPHGSGIGLSLSRQMMQAHGGTLSLQSDPETQTVFCLKFGGQVYF